MLRRTAQIVVAGALVLLAAGYGGALHPAGDSLAVFAGLFAVAGLMAIPFAGLSRAASVLACLAMVVAAVPRIADRVAPASAAAPETGPFLTLYQKNLHHPRRDRAPLIADIRAEKADIVTLQEVTRVNLPVLDALLHDYPTQVACPFESYGAIAVLSRWPAVPGSETCLPYRGLAAVRLDTPAGQVWAAAVHLHWPWPFQQAGDVAGLLPDLAALGEPLVIGGDFNMVMHSALLRRVMAATGTERARPVRPTFNLPLIRLGIAIDHVLVPRGASADVKRRPKFSSDHRGLVARIAMPAAH